MMSLSWAPLLGEALMVRLLLLKAGTETKSLGSRPKGDKWSLVASRQGEVVQEWEGRRRQIIRHLEKRDTRKRWLPGWIAAPPCHPETRPSLDRSR